MRPKGLVLLGTCLVASGCYTYLPTRPEQLTPGTSVRMRLTAQQADELYAQRLTDARLMDGTLIRSGDGGYLVETPVGHNDAQRGMRSVLQRVSVPTTAVLEIEQRTLNKGRTGLVFGAATVVMGAVIANRLRGGRGGEEGPGPGTSEARRVPLIRWSLPF